MMARKKLITCLGIVAFSVVAIGEASADSRGLSRPELRSERREILNRRAEIRRDIHVLNRRTQDLRRDLRPTPPRQTYIPRHSYRGYHRDHRGIGWYGHPNGRWYRYPPRYGWWR